MLRALLASSALLLAAGPALADDVQPTLSLSATADVQVRPDFAMVQSGVVTRATTARQAVQDNTRAMTGVFDALRRAGITGDDVQTSQLTVSPVYADRRLPDGQDLQITGYETRNTVTARVRDTGAVGTVIDAMIGAGANNIQNVSFGAEDTAAAMNQARREAIATLLETAGLFADAGGFELCGIIRMGENASRPVFAMMSRAEFAQDSSTPVAAGQLTVTASINADFCIVSD